MPASKISTLSSKIALILQYDGSAFHGWQKQDCQRTVQQVLELALAKVANHDIHTFVAGRTDAGVHATAQVVHFETTTQRDLKAWVLGTNSYLPADIRVRSAKIASPEFHARFSALARRYCYRISNDPIKPALFRQYVAWEYRKLDATKMHTAAQYLLGEQDFASFRGAHCQSQSTFRRVDWVNVSSSGSEITIEIQANAFLQHMVRNIAGVLMAIGFGEKPIDWIKEVLAARDRRAAARTAPPNGLYLVEVIYSNDDLLIRS